MGDRLSRRWKTLKLSIAEENLQTHTNLQTIKPKSITIKQNLHSQPHPHPYRLQEGETEEGIPQNGIPESETRKKEKERGAYLSMTEATGLQREMRVQLWFSERERERESRRGGKTEAAAERVRARGLVLNFCSRFRTGGSLHPA